MGWLAPSGKYPWTPCETCPLPTREAPGLRVYQASPWPSPRRLPPQPPTLAHTPTASRAHPAFPIAVSSHPLPGVSFLSRNLSTPSPAKGYMEDLNDAHKVASEAVSGEGKQNMRAENVRQPGREGHPWGPWRRQQSA